MKTWQQGLLSAAALSLVLVGCSDKGSRDDLDYSQLTIPADELVRNEDLAYQLAESLVTKVGPRMPGTDGDHRSVEWAVKKFERLGYDRVWTEEFPMTHWERKSASFHVLPPFNQSLHMKSLGHSISAPEGGIRARVVEFASIEALEAADPAQVEGRIVFINRAMERHPRGATYGPAVRGRSLGAVEAAKKGAVAVVIRSIGTSINQVAHTGMMRYEDGVTKIPAAALSIPDANQLSRMLARQPELIVDFDLQNISHGEVMSRNVIAEMRGTEAPEEIVLIGAHLDSWDTSHGAQDDAAGVGIVMATGALLRDRGQTRRTVRVVLFGAEEIGLVGARAYTDRHMDDMHNHVFASESDFGSGRVFSFDTNWGENALSFADEIQQRLSALGISRGHNNSGGGPDITFMQQAGVPVARLQQDGTYYFDVHHTPNDVFETINKDDLRQNVRAWLILTEMLANSDVDLRQ
ncbi:MAG: M20/M25/M40 family metallo-hydrolase [Idiomarina sp.]|nr:M20/M25/M40 family metallo-hydrolase [Idiomarina sp.]